MEISQQIAERVEKINGIIGKYLPKEEGFQKTIFEAMNYSVKAGGKRLRPMLMEETFQMFGGKGEVVEPFMAAIEMIHTYSLVHDDLPAMDNDEYRRGKKTTHAVYGEAMGILTGDALLNYAFETATEAFEIEPDNRMIGKALRVLSRKSGVYGMVGGQVVDVENEKNSKQVISKAELDFIYALKTGALIEASMMVGAILAGVSEEELVLVQKCASKLGLAFQIQDDILDVTSTLEKLGKPIGSDAKNHKITYVTFEGLEKSQKDVARLSEEASNILASLHREDRFLQDLFCYLINREN